MDNPFSNMNGSDDCGCREKRVDLTPVSAGQRPGLPTLRYRVGTHGRFKAAMAADISHYPNLRGLSTRDDGDPSNALMDACAVMLDVLTFYQERIANEGFLRTATERRSILELAGAIGYELGPGVAASALLAFTVEDAPGTPGYAIIDKKTKVQSIPGPGETPQIFETLDRVDAKALWNTLKPRLLEPQTIRLDMNAMYLKGTSLQLKAGDMILIIGDERRNYTLSENWDVRIIHTVATDADKGHTVVTWLRGLGRSHTGKIINPASKNTRVFVMRQRAALFGHNAPDPRIMKIVDTTLVTGEGANSEWIGFSIDQAAQMIDLDAAYPKILKDGWLILSKPGLVDDTFTEVYRIEKTSLLSRKDFAIASETTRLILDTDNNLDQFGLRETTVYVQSEELEMAEVPFTSPEKGGAIDVKLGAGMLTPVDGAQITLDRYVPGLLKGQTVIVSGRRARLHSLADDISGIHQSGLLPAGSILQVMGHPRYDAGKVRFSVQNPTHFVDEIEILPFITEAIESLKIATVEYVPADKDDETIGEGAVIESIGEAGDKTILYLKDSLKNVYDRSTVSIHGNCVRATHGETKTEVMGSGDTSLAFQKFTLKQTPLTYVSAATPSGGVTTLEVRVNNILWREVTSLYGQGGKAQVYTAQIGDDGKVAVHFGDGVTGARLPTGVENVTAAYRVGTGLEGRVKAKQLSLLMTRPLGLKAVQNPGPSDGANDPETRDNARQNAPFTVRTFDRIVSLKDYNDFVRRFSGIGKARATWLWNGSMRFVHITVAAADGGEVKEKSDLFTNLNNAIRTNGLPHQHFLVQSFTQLSFTMKAKVQVKQGYLPDVVAAAVRSALTDHFSFARRNFGQAVTGSEVIALIQGIEGVEMADLDFLKQGIHREPLLPARTAWWDRGTESIHAAELLTVNAQGIELTVLEEKSS
jgi:hypothetical protein